MIAYSTTLNALGPYKDDSGNQYWIVNGTKTYYNPGPYNSTPGTVPTTSPVNQITTPITPNTPTTPDTTTIPANTTTTTTTDTTTQPTTTTNNNMLYIALGILAVILIRKLK